MMTPNASLPWLYRPDMIRRPGLLLVTLVSISGALAAPLPDTSARILAEAAAGGDKDAARVEAEFILGDELAGDRGQARATLEAAAGSGDAQAAYVLGVLDYRAGDSIAARRRWQQAADAGHLDAHYNLGLLLLREGGDPGAADGRFEAAARGGHVLACYAFGTRLAVSAPLAARPWLECAARQGYAPAQFNLAALLARTPRDVHELDEARRWYAAAAATFAPAAGALAALPATLAKPAPAAAPTALALRDDAWVLAQPAAAYTVQIASGTSAAVLQAMLERELSQGDAACVQERPGARQAYSAIVGVYADRDSAEAARAALPAGLRVNHPWVRRMSSLQQALRNAANEHSGGSAAQADSN